MYLQMTIVKRSYYLSYQKGHMVIIANFNWSALPEHQKMNKWPE